MKNFYRTDLACEAPQNKKSEFNVILEEINGISTIFSISNHTGKTECITIYTGKCWQYEDDYSSTASYAVSRCLKIITEDQKIKTEKILIVGLGNRKITSDSLGPSVIDLLFPTSHIDSNKKKIATLATGVEGQSGFSSFDLITSASSILHPDLIVAVDSLCSINIEWLSTTIQLSASGIMPGSGVGNHKHEISKSTLGIPVIAIGVPTVTDLGSITDNETAVGYYVSPIDIDLSVDSMASIISDGIKKAYYK
ncbi:MAG: GPR endopeptidase [Clostridia bacterium]|nr:GPR endopeptidase [Clostridia bacterium]